MLPRKLTLENFMSYRGIHDPIDLTGFGVACLAGPNGSGKSSLLDSITWVLWGRSRAGYASDPLVSAGEPEMAVDMEFTSGDAFYRVIRRHRKPTIRTKTGLTTLDLQAWDGNQFTSLTGSSIRATQRSIVKLIGLDYETFINTSYFAQGRADLFSKKTPAERKKLLGEILGLDSYGELSSESRSEAREKEIQSKVYTSRIESINSSKISEDDLKVKISELDREISILDNKSGDIRSKVTKLNQEIARMNQSMKEISDIQKAIPNLENEAKSLERSKVSLKSELEQANVFLERSDQITEGYKALLKVRGKLANFGEKAGQLSNLEAQRNLLEGTISKGMITLQEKIAILKSEIESIEKDQTKYNTLKQSTVELRTKIGDLETKKEANERIFNQLSDLNIELERLLISEVNLQDDLENILAKQTMLSSHEHDACPLCGNELSEHNVSQVREHYEGETAIINTTLSKLDTEIIEKRDYIKRLDDSAGKEKTELRKEIKELENRLNRQSIEEEALKERKSKLISLRSDLSDISIKEEEMFVEERSEIQKIEKEIGELNYDFGEHQKIQTENRRLSQYEEEYVELSKFQQLEKHNTALLEDIDKRLLSSQIELDKLNTDLGKVESQRTILRESERNLNVLESELSVYSSDLVSKTRKRDEYIFTLQQSEKEKNELSELLDLRKKVLEEKATYDELSLAFGVKGVQALLVETAVPQIEKDANELLAKMTDNSMNIRLATQRQTKAGDSTETLDIIIGDEWGTRSYELYSGGENFRIDFALRIALSKLLSRRAGTKVPLLFIDEGFGTQDQTGKNKLVEAIGSLREDPEFESGLILVITHVDDIINQFDIRIQIEKNEHGSSIKFVA